MLNCEKGLTPRKNLVTTDNNLDNTVSIPMLYGGRPVKQNCGCPNPIQFLPKKVYKKLPEQRLISHLTQPRIICSMDEQAEVLYITWVKSQTRSFGYTEVASLA